MFIWWCGMFIINRQGLAQNEQGGRGEGSRGGICVILSRCTFSEWKLSLKVQKISENFKGILLFIVYFNVFLKYRTKRKFFSIFISCDHSILLLKGRGLKRYWILFCNFTFNISSNGIYICIPEPFDLCTSIVMWRVGQSDIIVFEDFFIRSIGFGLLA